MVGRNNNTGKIFGETISNHADFCFMIFLWSLLHSNLKLKCTIPVCVLIYSATLLVRNQNTEFSIYSQIVFSEIKIASCISHVLQMLAELNKLIPILSSISCALEFEETREEPEEG